jgi:hypothetical protein
MISREDILSELEKELGDLLADAPEVLSEKALVPKSGRRQQTCRRW